MSAVRADAFSSTADAAKKNENAGGDTMASKMRHLIFTVLLLSPRRMTYKLTDPAEWNQPGRAGIKWCAALSREFRLIIAASVQRFVIQAATVEVDFKNRLAWPLRFNVLLFCEIVSELRYRFGHLKGFFGQAVGFNRFDSVLDGITRSKMIKPTAGYKRAVFFPDVVSYFTD